MGKIKARENSILQYWFHKINIKILASLTKVGMGVVKKTQNFDAGFVKPKLYNKFSYILFNVFD